MSDLKIYRKKDFYPSLLDSFFRNSFFGDDFLNRPFVQDVANFEWDNEKEEYSVCIEAPGFSKEEIKIESNSKGLFISGEIQREEMKKALGSRKIDYVFKHSDLDSNTVKAELKDGILLIRVKKAKDKASKYIEIS